MKDFIVIGMEQIQYNRIRVYNDHGNIYTMDYYSDSPWMTMTRYEYACHHTNKIMQEIVYNSDYLTNESKRRILANIRGMLCEMLDNEYIKETEKTFYCDIRPSSVLGM